MLDNKSKLENEIIKIISENRAYSIIRNTPEITFEPTSTFATATVKMAYLPDDGCFAVNENYVDFLLNNRLELFLAVSHEFRHVWQNENGLLDRNAYQMSDKVALADYNLQPAEIDAWAWAEIMTSNTFHVRPTLEKNLGEEFAKKIKERINEIIFKKIY